MSFLQTKTFDGSSWAIEKERIPYLTLENEPTISITLTTASHAGMLGDLLRNLTACHTYSHLHTLPTLLLTWWILTFSLCLFVHFLLGKYLWHTCSVSEILIGSGDPEILSKTNISLLQEFWTPALLSAMQKYETFRWHNSSILPHLAGQGRHPWGNDF